MNAARTSPVHPSARLGGVHKSRPRTRFAHISNEVWNRDDHGLRPDEIGILTWLLSKPADWQTHTGQIEKFWRLGRSKVQRILKNLIAADFGATEVVYGEGHRIEGTAYWWSDDRMDIRRLKREIAERSSARAAGNGASAPAPQDSSPPAESSACGEQPPRLNKEKILKESVENSVMAEARPASADGLATGSAREGISGEAVSDPDDLAGFEVLVHGYKPEFFDDRGKCLRIWRHYGPEERAMAVSRLPQFLQAHAAMYAKWANAPRHNRPRRPPKHPVASEYLGDRLWRSIPAPITSAPDPVDAAMVAAEKAGCEGARACNRYAPGAVFVAADDPAMTAWVRAFKRTGAGVLSHNWETFPEGRRLGRYFPTRWPPGSDVEQRRERAERMREQDEHAEIPI